MKNFLYITLVVILLAGCTQSANDEATNTETSAENHQSGAVSIQPSEEGNKLVPTGWREAVFSVSNLEQWISFYTEKLGWEIIEVGEIQRATLVAWGLADSARAEFALMANPGSKTGFIRIVDFDNVEQVRIRDHDQSWETGGIYNVNMRVTDMASLSQLVTEAGWQGPSAPVQFTFGPFIVWEWIPRHPDGIRQAFIERVQPPLEGWPNLKITSRTFNSTQMVESMEAAKNFYVGVLGFRTYLEHNGPSEQPGEQVLGMSREAMTRISRDVTILSPQGDNEGSVELLAYDGYSGRNFSSRAVPPNLGILMLRYPVPDVNALAIHLESHGIDVAAPVTETEIEPYGPVKTVAVQAPDGAWLEFFELRE